VRRSGLAVLAIGVVAACGDPLSAPEQPVPFSHKVHAGDNRIGCPMCHVYAERGPVAGIPSMARCAGCHRFVGQDKPNVQKVMQAVAAGVPIEWLQVHRLPDHVFFTHERHLAAGLVCAACHGDVATMEVMKQVSPLTMGWCIDCHRSRQAPTDCLTCHK
jgi:cytochrome c7-like protein